MRRSIRLIMAIMLTATLPSLPALAITAQQKMETCKFGADDRHLEGPARKRFLDRCMSNRNDPRGPAPHGAAHHAVPPPKN